MRARLITGTAGTAINRGDAPWVGPLHPIPQTKTAYPRASQPVLLRNQCITHAEGSNYAQEAALLSGSPGFAPSASYVGARNFSGNGSAKTAEHIVWIPIPKWCLNNNPETLVDLRANNDNEILLAHALSFLLMAVSTVHISTTKEHAKRAASLSPGMFVATDGTVQPRTEAFVHSVFAPDADHPDGWMELVGALPRDPAPGEPTKAAETPNVFVLNELNHPSRAVGYLIQVVYHDPTLHPNIQFAYTILTNRMLKMVDERANAEEKMGSLLFRTNRAFTAPVVGAPPGGDIGGGAGSSSMPMEPPRAKEDRGMSGDEADELDEEDIDSEKEAAEAEAMREKVEARSAAVRKDPANTDEGRRLAERLNALVRGASASNAPAIKESAFERNAKKAPADGGDDSSSDGGSYDPSKPEEDDEGEEGIKPMDEDSVASSGSRKAKKSPAARVDKEMKDRNKEEEEDDDKDEGEEEDKEEDPENGMTLDELVAKTAAEENDGNELDSEEERELAERRERRSKRASAKKASASSSNHQVEEEERLIREKAASINAQQQARHREVNHGSNPFAIESIMDADDCKEQCEKELRAIKELGPAYRALEASRYRVALQHREMLPCLFGRSILDLKLLSTTVMDPILRASGSTLSVTHRDGMYDTASNLNVEPYKYWMLDPSAPLHYTKFCSFEVARQVLLRSFPERIGMVCSAVSPQFDYFSYCGTPEDPFLRSPFPWLTTSYRTEHLNPEVLAAYRPPGAMSACDAMLDRVNADEAQDRTKRNAANRRLAELYEHPKAQFVGQTSKGATDTDLSGVPHIQSPTELIVELNKLAKDHKMAAAMERAKVDDATLGSKRKSASAATTQRSIVQYDNDYDVMRSKLNRASQPAVRTYAADAGISAVSKERASFGAHAVLHGSRIGDVDNSGKRNGDRAGLGTNPIELKRMRFQSMNDQMAWLSRSLRSATDEADRELIQRAITRINEQTEDRRSATLSELFNPGEKSVFSGVAECCRRVLARASGGTMGSGNDAAASGVSNLGTMGGEASLPVHPSNEGSAEVLASYGDVLGRTQAQLSEYKIDGPIDKLAETRAKKYEQIVATSLKLPLRSNTRAMRDWLNKQCPDWTTEPAVLDPKNAALAEECDIPLEDCQVLIAMNYEREERLRHEWLSDVLVIFRGESSSEVCSVMSATNEDLSDSLRSLLMWLNSRPDRRVMVRPVLTFDPTLTPLATAFVHDLIDTAECRPMNPSFGPRMMRCMWVERLTMLRAIDNRLPDILMLHGPPGCGKSLLFTLIADGTPRNVMHVNHWSSKLALMTPDAKGITNTCTIHHEAPAVWAESSGNDPHHREQANMLKSMATEQSVVYRRNGEDPKTAKRRLEKIHLVYHHNLLMGTNTLNAARDKLDRMRAETSMAPVSKVRGVANNAAALGDGSSDANRQRAAKAWQDERWDEVAIIALVEAMISCKALPEVDIKVFDAVLRSGEAVISGWLGQLTDSNRPYQRGGNEARQLALRRTHHVYFRSEASPFLTLTTEIDESTGRPIPHLTMDKPKEFVARDLPTLIPTALFCTYGEAIPAYFSLLHTELLNFDEWRILNVIAAMLGFTDDYLATSYHRFGIKLPDILGRANQRRPPSSQEFKARRDTCSYLRDYYDNFESRVRQLAVSNQLTRARSTGSPRPRFISTNYFRRLVPGASDCMPQAPNAAKMPGERDPPQDPELNATMIFESFSSPDELISAIVSNCQGIVSGIDREVVRSLLQRLSERPAVRAPMHKSMTASTINAAELGFEGTSVVSGLSPGQNTETIAPLSTADGSQLEIQWRPIPILKVGTDSFSRRSYVAISTYALMIKWPELIYMALTAHEGPHTREARCLLPIGYTDAPLLMHVWTTRPNPFGSSSNQTAAQYQSVTSSTSMRIRTPVVLPGDHRAREKNRGIVEGGRAIDTQLYDMSVYDKSENGKFGGKDGAVNPMSCMDLEMERYVHFLKNINYVPTPEIEQAPAQVQDVLARYAYIAPSLLNAPGNVEKYINYLRQQSPELKTATSVAEAKRQDNTLLPSMNYPEDDLIDTLMQNDLAFARQEFDANPDAPIDGQHWREYMYHTFPRDLPEDFDKAKLERMRDLLEEVKAIEDRRQNPLSADEAPPPHHKFYPQAMISYRAWLRGHQRNKECFDTAKRREVLTFNKLTKIGLKALGKDSPYDTLTDYLTATSPGNQATLRLRNGARVPAAPPRAVGQDEDSLVHDGENGHTTAGNATSAGESDALRKLEQFANNLASGGIGAASARQVVASGRSARANAITNARKKKAASSGQDTSQAKKARISNRMESLRGADADDELPARGSRRRPPTDADEYT